MSVDSISSSLASSPSLETAKASVNNERVTSNIEKPQELSEEKLSKESVEKLVNSMNDFLQASSTHLKFEYHEKLNEYYVTIVDNHTEEVVREIPSKKLLDIYSAMTDFLGIIVDKKI